MKTYQTPLNVLELLDGVVNAAKQTEAYSWVLECNTGVSSFEQFSRIPVTAIEVYREHHLADVLADTSEVEWIVGRDGDHPTPTVAVVENPSDPENRFDVFWEAIDECIPGHRLRTCAIVSSLERSSFAAEIGMLMSSRGYPSHLFLEQGGQRIYECLDVTDPDILVILSGPLDEVHLPDGIELCVTFRLSQRINRFRQLDVYSIDEFGFLAQSSDCEKYILNNDDHYFECSYAGKLVITALHNRVQPLVRLESRDKVKMLGNHVVEFDGLSSYG